MQTWFITGASSGLGEGIARSALARGLQVVLTARDKSRVEALAGACPSTALAVSLDLTDENSMRDAVHAAEERFGHIDVLINNAGHGYRAAIEESEDAAVAELFQANFFGHMKLARLVLPSMRERHAGTIVSVTSVGAVRGALGNGYYSAAKGALELASEALAKEVERLGIRVMLVEPGALRTGFYGERLAATVHTIADYDEISERYRKTETTDSGDQPGDPERSGEVVCETLLGEHGELPQRLLLGSDCVAASRATLTARLEELETWAPVAAKADFGA